MNKYITEFIGTFFLVFTITLAVVSQQPLAPLAIGGILMSMIYMGGHISGGHYNPAVSLAAMMRGALPASDFVPYVVAQVLAGIAAAFLGNYVTAGSVPIAPADGVGFMQTVIVEVLFTFALALTVLNSATDDATKGNSFYGLAIGFVVVCGAFAAGSMFGAGFNPAVGIGLSLGAMSAGTGGGMIALYAIAPFVGGALAAMAFRLQHPE